MENKEIVLQNKSSEIATQASRDGFEENINSSDLIIPRARLFQGTPTEQEQNPDLKMGQVFNSLTKELLPSTFVPVWKWTEVLKFNPRDPKDPLFDDNFEPASLIWKATGPSDPKWSEGDFGPNGEKPTALRVMNFMAYFVGVPMPLILSFTKTSYKAGKTLLSIAQFSGGNMYDRRYRLGVKKEKKDDNIYHIYTVTFDGMSTPEEVAIAKKWYGELRQKNVQVHDESNVAWEE